MSREDGDETFQNWSCEMNPNPKYASCSVPEEEQEEHSKRRSWRNVQEIIVYKDSYREENVLGIIHISENDSIEDMRRLIKEELGHDASSLFKRDCIPIHRTQDHKPALLFFRTVKDYVTIKKADLLGVSPILPDKI